MPPALRNQASARLVQSFSATAPKVQPSITGARNLSISGPKEAHNSFESTVASIPKRSDITPSGQNYNTSRTMKQVNDSSTVDFAYIPTTSSFHTPDLDDARIPLLPDNSLIKHEDSPPEPHVPAVEVSTATLTDAIVNISDVVATVSEAEISKAADSIGLHKTADGKESAVRHVWNGVLDDVFGAKKSANA